MAEFTPLQENLIREGLHPNTANSVLELHRLLAIFLSSKSFAALRINFPGENFDPIYEIQEVEEDEITRLLLTLAITARVIDDREGRTLERLGTRCGQLIENLSREKDIQDLNLREACNKIIHAKKIRFDRDGGDEDYHFNPIIYLYGEQRRVQWKATLEIVEFSKEYYSLMCHF